MTQQEYIKHIKAINGGERMVPESWKGQLSVIHSHYDHWYKVASLLNKGLTIELGCGCGIPARIYSIKTECPVIAVDREDVIQHVELITNTPGVRYISHDFNNKFSYKLWNIGEQVSNIVCIDVLEHIRQPYLKQMLECMSDISNDLTQYIISVPIHPDGIDGCSFHVNIWRSKEEVIHYLGKFLNKDKVILI